MFREFCLKQVITSVLCPMEKWLLFRSSGAVNMLENSDYLTDSRLKDVRSATQRNILRTKFFQGLKACDCDPLETGGESEHKQASCLAQRENGG